MLACYLQVGKGLAKVGQGKWMMGAGSGSEGEGVGLGY